MKTPKILLGLLLAGLLMTAGCNATQDAQRAEAVIASIVGIAQAEESALPAADAAILTPWATLGATLDGQLKSCIASAGSSGSKKSAFLACFNTFSQGLLSSSELAQLRVVSPASQAKVQLIVTAISTGLNVAIAAMGGTPTPPPQVADRQPTRGQLMAFARQNSLPYGGF
jgi:hypothetical protein